MTEQPGRDGRRACPFYRPEHVARFGVTLAEHLARCPDWHQDGAEDQRRSSPTR